MAYLGFPDPGLLRVGVLLQLHPGQDEVVGAQLQRLLAAHHDPSPNQVLKELSHEKKIPVLYHVFACFYVNICPFQACDSFQKTDPKAFCDIKRPYRKPTMKHVSEYWYPHPCNRWGGDTIKWQELSELWGKFIKASQNVTPDYQNHKGWFYWKKKRKNRYRLNF